ncbi:MULTISPECIES: hypothetical protein [Stenotrophomonas]|jgi:hypothetical protein|uniref:hypothetical protein n=1 Tax=Stenotrophomonas TaxID=40323 RepID=UPI000D1B3399|nr:MULTISPECIES: hypothetical protein [Stenotrophomonas]AWT14866.1 hypothetical protein DM611_11610 [Stenotrophomonas maltophilia]MBN5019673.1 hypothetical protein [Stenotrophomonas maltophilia]MCU0999679.1 hypothetical protein [Stenotrophomonas maltophilia]
MARTKAAINPDYVFINCPFTTDYRALFDCMVFTILACGFQPRSALEAADGGDVRMDKIVRLIKESTYSIHDLSAVALDDTNNLPRFNMPFELGMVIGCKKIAGRAYASRSVLILEQTKYTSQKCLSDIAGQDLKAHGGQPQTLCRIVRSWLVAESGRSKIPGQTAIFNAYTRFSAELPDICGAADLEYEELIYPDLVGLAQQWLQEQAKA